MQVLQALRYLPDWILLVLELGGLALLTPSLGRTLIASTATAGALLAGVAHLGGTTSVGPWLMPILSTALPTAAAAGYYRVLRRWKPRKKPGAWLRKPIFWSALTVGLTALTLWSVWLADTDGLPSHHDGVVHSTFFVRVWQQGAFPLTAGKLPFGETFGSEAFENYPVGAHLLANLLSLPHRLLLAPLGATTADYLKATLILVCAGLPVLVLLAAWSLLRTQLWAAVLAGIAALTYYRFPVVATDQGGWSRIFALGAVWLWSAEFFARPTPEQRRGWWMVLLGSFFLHPQACVAVCLVLTCIWIFDLHSGRERLLWLAGGLLTLAAGWWLTPYTQTGAQLAAAFPMQPFSIDAALNRISFLIGQSIFGEPHARELSLLSRRSLGVVGMLFLLTRPRTRQAAWTLLWLGILCGIALSVFAPWAPVRIAGMVFYHQTDRIAELFYLPLALSWAAGAGWILRLPERTRFQRGGMVVIGLLLAQGLGWKFVRGTAHLQEHFRHMGSVHQSPRFSTEGAAIRALESQLTGEPTLLVATPGLTDSWPFRLPDSLHVESLFIFGECPVGGAEIGIHFQGQCAKRRAFFESHAHPPLEMLEHYRVLRIPGEPARPER